MEKKKVIIGASIAAGIIALFTAKKLGMKNATLAKALYDSYGHIKETDSRFRRLLQEFWKAAGIKESSINWYITSRQPWSAAFISYVMTKSGHKDFPVSASHSCFAAKIKKGNIPGYELKRVTEYSPKVGDIVLKNRGYGVNFDNLHCGQKSHSDIVFKKDENYLYTIGGNVGDKISITKVPINKNGKITNSKYFAIIKVK